MKDFGQNVFHSWVSELQSLICINNSYGSVWRASQHKLLKFCLNSLRTIIRVNFAPGKSIHLTFVSSVLCGIEAVNTYGGSGCLVVLIFSRWCFVFLGVLRFFLGGGSIFLGGGLIFLGGAPIFWIINFDKNFIENIYFLLFENFIYRLNLKKSKNIVILFKFNCCGEFILCSLIILKTLVTVSI